MGHISSNSTASNNFPTMSRCKMVNRLSILLPQQSYSQIQTHRDIQLQNKKNKYHLPIHLSTLCFPTPNIILFISCTYQACYLYLNCYFLVLLLLPNLYLSRCVRVLWYSQPLQISQFDYILTQNWSQWPNDTNYRCRS